MNDLERWNADLRDEIEQLKATLKTLCGDGETHLPFKLSPMEERLLRLLLVRDFASYTQIDTILYWDKQEIGSPSTVKVYLSNIRRKLPAIKPWLICKPGRGYYLKPEGKHWIRAELLVARAA